MLRNIESIRDIRLNIAHSYNQSQDITYRPAVDALQKLYEPFVDGLKNQKKNKQTLQLEKFRGDLCIIKTIVVSDIVKRKLNSQLPKIEELSKTTNGFVVKQLSKLLRIHRGAAHKYINILLASNILTSNGKSRAARYAWNYNSVKSCL